MAVCFLEQIKRTNGTWDKGVVVKEAETEKEAFDMAQQSFHSYLGAYAFGNAEGVDFVCVSIRNTERELKAETWDNMPVPVEEELEV